MTHPTLPLLTLLSWSCLLLSACNSSSHHQSHSSRTEPGLLYSLGDDELNRLGERLGFQVHAMGLGNYDFTKGRLTFAVWRKSLPTEQGTLVQMPLQLTHQPPGRQIEMMSILPVAHGVTFEAVQAHFHAFIQRIEAARRRG